MNKNIEEVVNWIVDRALMGADEPTKAEARSRLRAMKRACPMTLEEAIKTSSTVRVLVNNLFPDGKVV